MHHLKLVSRTTLCMFVLSIFLTNINLYAASTVYPNWSLNTIYHQDRVLTTDYSGTGAVLGGASLIGNVSGASLTVDTHTVSTEDNPKEAYDNGAAYVVGGAGYMGTFSGNSVNINNSTIQGRDIIGGAAFLEDPADDRMKSGTANNNTVVVKDSNVTFSSSFVPAGSSTPIQSGGNVIGGYSNYATSTTDNNTVVIDNSTVAGMVVGAMGQFNPIEGIDYDEPSASRLWDYASYDVQNARNNYVSIINGSNVDTALAVYYSENEISGNTLLIDNSTVGTASISKDGSRFHANQLTQAIKDNTMIIRNGATISDAVAIDAVDRLSTTGNSLLVDNAAITGQIRTVLMHGVEGYPNHAPVSANHLTYQNYAAATTADEIGAVLNLAGTANENTVLINNMTGGVTVNRPAYLLGDVDFATWDSYGLISVKNISNTFTNVNTPLNASYGFIYGGATYNLTTQRNDTTTVPTPDSEGNLPEEFTTVPDATRYDHSSSFYNDALSGNTTTADGNTVTIKGSTVNSNIAGGIAGQVQAVDYATWTYTPASGTDPAKYTKTTVQKIGNTIITTTYDCGASGTSCTPTGTPETATVTDFDSTVISASNNTVILEDSAIDGTVYGGYVFGADLKANNVKTENNTVILRGNATLSASSVLYGGTSSFGRTTNKLVFDRVSDGVGGFVTYNNKNQFQNFNSTWQINADFDTRINFNFSGVRAAVNVDNSMGEGSATIIQTQTGNDLTDVEQNGVLTDLVDSAINLSKERQGIYSFTLTPTKAGASTIGWVLSSAKDKHNVELYGQVPLVGLVLAAEGPDMLSRTFEEAWASEADHNVFVNGGYNHTRYITGSGFDVDAGTAQAGLWTKLTPDWMGGLFAKYAGGKYETFPLDADGTATAWGGGLMSSYFYSELGRLEASAEVGYMRLKFDSDQLYSSLKSNGMYYSLAGGIVQGLLTNWDIFTRVQYLHKDSDKMKDNLGQSIEYSAMNSLSLKAGTNYRFENIIWQGLTPMIGVSGLYEFAGESKVNVLGVSNNSASLKGLSGRADLGLTFNNTESNAILPIVSQLTVFGQAGNRRGFGAEVNISVQF